MDAIPPRQDPAISKGEAPSLPDLDLVQFRGRRVARREDDGISLFYLGLVVFVAVALAFPWYSYWVSSYLAKRDLALAAEQLGIQMKAESAKWQQTVARGQAAQAEAARIRDERQRQFDIQTVRVVGVSTGGVHPTVLVDFGRSNFADAGDRICGLAARWLKHDVGGQVLSVQRYQGSRPAAFAGELACR